MQIALTLLLIFIEGLNLFTPPEGGNSFTQTIKYKYTITYKYMKKQDTKYKFVTKYTAHTVNSIGEVNNLPSQTIPGESYGIGELIRMSVTGEIPVMAKGAFKYDTDQDKQIDIDDNIEERNIQDLTEGQKIIQDQIDLETEIEENKLELKKQKAEQQKQQKLEQKEDTNDGKAKEAKSENNPIQETA